MAGGDQVQVLKALDLAKTQWFSFTAIVIVGMGFFIVAYDLFCISLVTKLLGRIYYHVDGSAKPGTLPLNVLAAVNDVAFCGMLAGQLFFGWLGAKLGRKKVYGMTLMMVVICSVASGLSFGHTPKSVMATLCFFRFWLGFGIGGEYLFSATIMSEYAIKKTRGAFIAAVFAMQGFGILAGGIVAILVSSFKAAFPALDYAINATRSTVPQADYVWRIILMSGALPAALTYYWRIKVPETARYTAIVPKNVSDMSKVMQFDIEAEPEKAQESAGNHFGLFSKQLLHLLGTTTTWFLLYMNALEEVYGIARAQTLIALCSTLAGYWFTVALIHKIRRFAIQVFSVGQRNFHNGLNSISTSIPKRPKPVNCYRQNHHAERYHTSSMLSTKRLGIVVITFVILALLLYACSLYHLPNSDIHYQRQQVSATHHRRLLISTPPRKSSSAPRPKV